MSLLRTLKYRRIILPKARRAHAKVIEEIRKRGKAKVVLVASNLPMWRHEGIYREMLKDPEHFEPHILILPFNNYPKLVQEKETALLVKHFNECGIKFEDESAMAEINPDIIFYPQCYRKIFGPGLNPLEWRDRLLCYFPYGVSFLDDKWQYDTTCQNILWKYFVQSPAFKDTISRLSVSRGYNVVAVGEPNADNFIGEGVDVWKPQDSPCKRVIWAPHHSFGEESRLRRTAFLWAADVMRELAVEYSGRIQFVFKPHPRLYVEMARHPMWGEEKTKEYFDFWKNGTNTQLEEGEYGDLFKTSDALVHNCNSFIAEYLYTQKPALFLNNRDDSIGGKMNDFGKAALESHYFAVTKDEISKFLDETVLGGADPKACMRKEAFETYLKPIGKGNFAANVVDEIRRSIWG